MSNGDIPNPDWTAWLARAEAETSGEDYIVETNKPYVMWPDRPDRGWRRLGDISAKIVAGLVGGGAALLALGAGIYALRVL
jgi:hypothetical protein